MTDEREPRRGSPLDDLRVDPSALEGDPFARRASLLASLRASGRGWVAFAIAIGVLFLGWQFRAPISNQVTADRPGPAPSGAVANDVSSAGPILLLSPDPPALKQQLVDELRAAGLDPVGYDRLGSSGVDVQLPSPLPDAARATFEKHRVPLPSDGVVRIEIAPAK